MKTSSRITLFIHSYGDKGALCRTLDSILDQGCFACPCVLLLHSPVGYLEIAEMFRELRIEAVEIWAGNVVWPDALPKTDYIGVLCAGDQLEVGAVSAVHYAIANHAESLCIYGDECKQQSTDSPCSFIFKPQYDPILQNASGYIGRSAVFKVAGQHLEFRRDMHPDRQVQELVNKSGMQITHVPMVLLRSSNCGEHKKKRLCIPKPFENPTVSIIVPTRDKLTYMRRCINSIFSITAYNDYEIIVVDNNSREKDAIEYLHVLETKDWINVIRDRQTFNYSRMNNNAVEHAHGEILCFLNNDIEILEPSWLSSMVAWIEQKGVGAVGARLLYPDGTLQHAGVVLGINGYAGHPWKGTDPGSLAVDFRLQYPRTVSATTGACLLMRKSDFLSVGGFDENLAVAFNDVDLCLRLQRKGLRIVWTPEATLIHHESVSRGRRDTPEKRRRFTREKKYMRKRWGDRLKNDPYYNPNLTYNSEDGSPVDKPFQYPPKRWWQRWR